MSTGVWFWIIYVLAVVFNLWADWPLDWRIGGRFVTYILFFLVGWKLFGSPIRNEPNTPAVR